MAKSVAEVRDRFFQQALANMEAADNVLKATVLSAAREWHKVDTNGWSGNLADWDGIKNIFDREDNSNDFIAAIKSAEEPGVVGDMIVSNYQGEQLAVQERAFRARHTTKIAAELAAASRKLGQASDAGIIMRGIVGYADGMTKISKG